MEDKVISLIFKDIYLFICIILFHGIFYPLTKVQAPLYNRNLLFESNVYWTVHHCSS